MKMSVIEFVVPPAIVGRSRSAWHEIIDTVTEGPPRTAADEIAEYLRPRGRSFSSMAATRSKMDWLRVSIVRAATLPG